ncbi:DNA/RNA polymerase [Phytophthora megakarya]|uniref:DNA/RNA polymerase n=1 Tax=Phytophthora megakarya TaxID=4795 RepID=A0A225VWF2_9STRA|nr:DNA/RNA polymerase [Phytophthora megakarya]
MFTLLKKQNKCNLKIHFDKEQLKNFKELKRRLCELPDFIQPMHLRTDASKFAVGGVLFQWWMVLNAQSPFWIYCLEKSPIVETDHKCLEGLFTQKMANCRLARWYDILGEYQPIFSYLPGAKNGIADALRRKSDLQILP